MELLPSGTVIGGAMLYVEQRQKTILYAPSMQTATVPHVRPLRLKRADTLILGTHHADPQQALPDREQEQARLLAALERRAGQRVKIFCANIGTAQELTALASAQQLAVAVHQTIAAVNRVYQSFAVELGNYRIFNSKKDDWEVVILPLSLANYSRARRIAALTFHVYDNYPPSSVIAPPDESFCLSRTCSATEFPRIVAKVKPQVVFTCGDYAKAYRTALLPRCPRIIPLYAGNQPTLF